jgi:hypothetical protein
MATDRIDALAADMREQLTVKFDREELEAMWEALDILSNESKARASHPPFKSAFEKIARALGERWRINSTVAASVTSGFGHRKIVG